MDDDVWLAFETTGYGLEGYVPEPMNPDREKAS